MGNETDIRVCEDATSTPIYIIGPAEEVRLPKIRESDGYPIFLYCSAPGSYEVLMPNFADSADREFAKLIQYVHRVAERDADAPEIIHRLRAQYEWVSGKALASKAEALAVEQPSLSLRP